MKRKTYPKYKPSRVEWLGDVPEHWNVKQLKWIVAMPITDGPHETPEILDEGIPFISAEAIRNNKIDFERKRGFISEADHNKFSQKYHPKRDDIFMIKSGATTGNLAINESDEEFNIWSPLAVVRVHPKKALPRFVLAAMNSKEFQTSVQLFWSYGTQQNIGMNVIENLQIPVPALSEQKVIAEYLDRETAKIDSLISKKQQLLEKLKEYRTALISKVVTKGLDPNVKMKPSGVEWLGDVPEGWESVSLKWVSQSYAGGTPDKAIQDYWEDGTIPWLNSGAVNDFYIEEPSTYITEEAYRNSSAKWIRKGSLVIALAGQGKTKGMVAQLGIDTTCNQSMAAICPKSNINSRFLLWWLTRNYINIRNLAGGDQRDGLNLVMIGSIPIPLTPFPEQQAIADYLDRETGKIDSLVQKIENAIEKLKEYRVSLISAVVTGKIDVREDK